MEPTVLLEEVSPNGNLQAIVEQDERVAYLYLHSAPDTGLPRVRACWVRNLAPAPATLDEESLQAGLPPLLPADCCERPDARAPLEPEDLELVWFEEGDAVALLERGAIAAVLPCGAGLLGFSGYARDCTRKSPVAWPLPADGALGERIERAREFWTGWEHGEEAWPPIQAGLLEAYERHLGPSSSYYAIDGGSWPPQAMLEVPVAGGVAIVTAGVSIRPQPTVELQVENHPERQRRIELGMCLSEDLGAEVVEQVMRYLSAQTHYPWDRYTWLGEGHTFPCDVIPRAGHTDFPAAVLSTRPLDAPRVELPPYRGDPVNLLWFVPITAPERALAEREGSDALLRRLAAAGCSWIHGPRADAV